jgi:hypothetical protein
MQHARHGRSSGSRHAYRSATALRSAARRPRVLLMVAVAAAGLTVAFWLPTRNDSASANENGQRSSSGQYWDGHDRDGRHHNRWPSGSPSASVSAPPSDEPPTAPTSAPTCTTPPTSEPPASEPPTSEPPTSEPTTTSAPPTTAPPTTPPTTAPAATKWAPFTNYKAGQIVTYAGVKYEVLAAHTSLPGWEPAKLPELFRLV